MEKLYIGIKGHVVCLDKATGHVKWKNELSGLGYGSCIFATNQQGSVYASAYEEAQRQQTRNQQNT